VTSTPSDDALLTRARLGDAAAFRALVERYQSTVASVVIGMLGRGADADDVGQETFVRFHAALGDFRGDASLGTYLCRIAMNLSLNALKQRKRFALRFVSRDASPVPLAEPEVEAHELGEKQRPVVVLRMLHEFSTNETASMLQLPPGTVMSRLARGLAELERLLAPYMNRGA
jgi:RNA polymerase sigma-70 factor, ECF subfamily